MDKVLIKPHKNSGKYLNTTECFYYGRRLKAEIKIHHNTETDNRTFIGILYTHGMQKVGQKTFFNDNADYIQQNELYNKCVEYVMDYLNNKCVY